jgi:hypothetical protein
LIPVGTISGERKAAFIDVEPAQQEGMFSVDTRIDYGYIISISVEASDPRVFGAHEWHGILQHYIAYKVLNYRQNGV